MYLRVLPACGEMLYQYPEKRQKDNHPNDALSQRAHNKDGTNYMCALYALSVYLPVSSQSFQEVAFNGLAWSLTFYRELVEL